MNHFTGPVPIRMEVDPDGAFRIAGIPPGRYRLSVYNMPDNTYINAVPLVNVVVKDGRHARFLARCSTLTMRKRSHALNP